MSTNKVALKSRTSLIAPLLFKVTLSIVNSEEFIFKANQKQSVQIDIGPEASR
jgi:hypothetical protein